MIVVWMRGIGVGIAERVEEELVVWIDRMEMVGTENGEMFGAMWECVGGVVEVEDVVRTTAFGWLLGEVLMLLSMVCRRGWS
jgi:hypothetical protein